MIENSLKSSMLNSAMGLNNLGLNNTNTHYIRREVSLQNTKAAKATEENIGEQREQSHDTKRQTYGLAILELMSDQEYQAWLRATADMTESEKMLAVQKLYPLADIDRLKGQKKSQLQHTESVGNEIKSNFIINANKLNGMKMFNANANFIQRYKNAFDNIQARMDMNS